MSRTVHAFAPLAETAADAVAAFRDDPAGWLPDARRAGVDRFELTVGTATLDHPVLVTIGAPWHRGATCWRSWSWTPLPTGASGPPLARLLPDLDAELGLTRQPSGRLTLVLDGRYRPPGGRLGEAIDQVALGRVARRTTDRLLADVADRLGGASPAGRRGDGSLAADLAPVTTAHPPTAAPSSSARGTATR